MISRWIFENLDFIYWANFTSKDKSYQIYAKTLPQCVGMFIYVIVADQDVICINAKTLTLSATKEGSLSMSTKLLVEYFKV